MASKILSENEILYDYRIEEAACLWLSVHPSSSKGEFLKKFSKLRRMRKYEERRRRETPHSFTENAEEPIFDDTFEHTMTLGKLENPFIDSTLFALGHDFCLTLEQKAQINNDVNRLRTEFNYLVNHFNQLVMQIYKCSDIESYLENYVKPDRIKQMAETHFVNQPSTYAISSLTDAGIRKIASDHILKEDSFGIQVNSEILISRNELLRLARDRNEKPAFLFGSTDESIETDEAGVFRKTLHTTLYILANKLNYISGEKVSVSKAQRSIDSSGLSIDDKTMRKYLKVKPHKIKATSDQRNPRQESALLTCIYAFSQKLSLTPNSIDEIQELLDEDI